MMRNSTASVFCLTFTLLLLCTRDRFRIFSVHGFHHAHVQQHCRFPFITDYPPVSTTITDKDGGRTSISRRYQRDSWPINAKQRTRRLFAAQNADSEDAEFWARQKELVTEMAESSSRSLREEQRAKFAERRSGLVGDTAYFGFFMFCLLWGLFADPFVAISYSFGATMGLAYAYGLGKYVESLGGSVDETDSVQGAGVGQARFAFLILLFVIVGKFRSEGLQEIPAISGFFTYQLASLRQGLREFND